MASSSLGDTSYQLKNFITPPKQKIVHFHLDMSIFLFGGICFSYLDSDVMLLPYAHQLKNLELPQNEKEP
ncbi:hypothetical protein CN923_23495 [Bacillus cereus]|nr:hypothetical protein CON44_13765 [Bacillus cereus]PER26125.1 hypothetical protein CN485_21000 [Bacillus cereus]PEY99556.1 hypothetical protein CN349_14820 [Bacillus cereus]PFJ71384.1 hypothetical protein COI95_29095 [Bacillus cereus]PFK27939.1 hypothetical protein COJ05_07905 [Bacillus cereus]